jgi:hypothetical protein
VNTSDDPHRALELQQSAEANKKIDSELKIERKTHDLDLKLLLLVCQ